MNDDDDISRWEGEGGNACHSIEPKPKTKGEWMIETLNKLDMEHLEEPMVCRPGGNPVVGVAGVGGCYGCEGTGFSVWKRDLGRPCLCRYCSECGVLCDVAPQTNDIKENGSAYAPCNECKQRG